MRSVAIAQKWRFVLIAVLLLLLVLPLRTVAQASKGDLAVLQARAESLRTVYQRIQPLRK